MTFGRTTRLKDENPPFFIILFPSFDCVLLARHTFWGKKEKREEHILICWAHRVRGWKVSTFVDVDVELVFWHGPTRVGYHFRYTCWRGKAGTLENLKFTSKKKDGKGISIFLHPSPKRTSRVPSPAISLDEKLYRSLRTTQTPHVIRALRTHHEERISGRFFFVYRLWLCLVRACVRTMNPRLKTIGINPEKHASYGAGSGWVWCVPRNVLFIIFLSVSSSCPRGRRNTPKNARSR